MYDDHRVCILILYNNYKHFNNEKISSRFNLISQWKAKTSGIPNSPFQGSNKAILSLHLPEKVTASHDVAPKTTQIEHMIAVSP